MDWNTKVIELRRELHKIAELSFEEVKTSKYLRKLFEVDGIAVESMAGTGLVITLGSDLPGSALMLRADMDGLPIEEETDVPFRSTHPGTMHACGHDAHMAILATTLLWAKDQVDRIQRPVKFVFQPAEERGGGARVMVEQGVLENPPVGEVFGLHIANRLCSGVVGIKEGIASSFCDEFSVLVTGKGGHAARPYQCIEPIVLGSRIVLESQQIIARELSALKSAVITFTTIQSGASYNVIADTCELGGTLRSLSLQDREFIVGRLKKKFQAMEMEAGAKIEFQLH
ncbi:amidohydrolase, partial [bacterium]|nr:amidohydrolase [bacterium]